MFASARVSERPQKECGMLDEFKEVTETAPLTEEQFAHLGGGSLAYVRAIRSEDVSRLFP